jgi:rhombotail lipoprotein
VLTAVETTVFDIRSRRLLMRAAGTSTLKGSATMVGFSEAARAGRTKSFDEAVTQMIGNLHGEVKAFRERAPKDPMIKLVLPPGYNPNATQAPTR